MSTTTIIAGDLTRRQRDRRFSCQVCGAQFIAPYTDYELLDPADLAERGVEAACICPTCGAAAYSPFGSAGEVAVPEALLVRTLPAKQSYRPGETFASTGLVLEMQYSDGSVGEVDLTDCTFSPTASTPLIATDKKITVTHTDSELTVDVPILVQNQVLPLVEPVTASFVYTGAAQAVQVRNFDSDSMTRSNYSKTNAGEYTAAYTPKTGYCWPGGSTSALSIPWEITKADPNVELSDDELELTAIATPGTITVTRDGNGAVSAVSSDTDVCTVAVAGTTVTVTAVADGEAVVTISVAAGTNYNAAADVTCAVTVALT